MKTIFVMALVLTSAVGWASEREEDGGPRAHQATVTLFTGEGQPLVNMPAVDRNAKLGICRKLTSVPDGTPADRAVRRKSFYAHSSNSGLSASGALNFARAFDGRFTQLCNDPSKIASAFIGGIEADWHASCDEVFSGIGQRVPGTNRAVFNSDLYKCRRAGRSYTEQAEMFLSGYWNAELDHASRATPASADCAPNVNSSEGPRAIPPHDAEFGPDLQSNPGATHQ